MRDRYPQPPERRIERGLRRVEVQASPHGAELAQPALDVRKPGAGILRDTPGVDTQDDAARPEGFRAGEPGDHRSWDGNDLGAGLEVSPVALEEVARPLGRFASLLESLGHEPTPLYPSAPIRRSVSKL